jgi:hypothetical protein
VDVRWLAFGAALCAAACGAGAGGRCQVVPPANFSTFDDFGAGEEDFRMVTSANVANLAFGVATTRTVSFTASGGTGRVVFERHEKCFVTSATNYASATHTFDVRSTGGTAITEIPIIKVGATVYEGAPVSVSSPTVTRDMATTPLSQFQGPKPVDLTLGDVTFGYALTAPDGTTVMHDMSHFEFSVQ